MYTCCCFRARFHNSATGLWSVAKSLLRLMPPPFDSTAKCMRQAKTMVLSKLFVFVCVCVWMECWMEKLPFRRNCLKMHAVLTSKNRKWYNINMENGAEKPSQIHKMHALRANSHFYLTIYRHRNQVPTSKHDKMILITHVNLNYLLFVN